LRDAAVEAGQGLIVVNVSLVGLMPLSLLMGYGYIESDELTAALRAELEALHLRSAAPQEREPTRLSRFRRPSGPRG